jgi:hypothetical protein
LLAARHGYALERRLSAARLINLIEHTAIASPDPHRLADWYVAHLDFVINWRSSRSKTVFVKAANGAMIEIIESAPGTAPAEGMKDAGRYRRFAIPLLSGDRSSCWECSASGPSIYRCSGRQDCGLAPVSEREEER